MPWSWALGTDFRAARLPEPHGTVTNVRGFSDRLLRVRCIWGGCAMWGPMGACACVSQCGGGHGMVRVATYRLVLAPVLHDTFDGGVVLCDDEHDMPFRQAKVHAGDTRHGMRPPGDGRANYAVTAAMATYPGFNFILKWPFTPRTPTANMVALNFR